MYLVDTDILIWILRGDKRYLEWFENFNEDSSLSLSSVTIAEIYKNIFPSELMNTEAMINDFMILDVTASIAKQAGFYWQEYHPKLKTLSLIDCLIASTALIHNARLVTLNTKHFPMHNIHVLDPQNV